MKFLQYLKSSIEKNPYFFIPYFLFLIVGLFLLLFTKKEDTSIWINHFNTPFLDYCFRYITYIGDGWFYIGITVLLLFIKINLSLASFVSYATTGIFAQIAKRMLPMPRPKVYIDPAISLHYVNGVSILMFNSFPSGHATSAFSLFLLLSLITKWKPAGLIFFIIALLVGISRIYLLQHFLIDVYFGSLIGVVLTLIIYFFFQKYFLNRTKKTLNFSIINLIRKNNSEIS